MWVVIPLYRDKETATLFGYKASPQNIYTIVPPSEMSWSSIMVGSEC